MSRKRSLNFPFRRDRVQNHLPERHQFQVVLSLTPAAPMTRDELEADFSRALDTLIHEAEGVVLGPAGGIDFTSSTLELEFTVAALSPAVLYAKLGEVMRILEHTGFEYEGSREERLDLEPQPA